ncbi:hypothetical protein C0995_002981 [Termitomyces sp. Mi166|nr:hypothetical protein C0995_002981 [Termitomyces sp. Mi166\
MVERKSVINLLEAFAVSLKHYLRGEDDRDLYHLVKFLPAYTLPPAIPSPIDGTNGPSTNAPSPSSPVTSSSLPAPVSSPIPRRKTSFLIPVHENSRNTPKEKVTLPRVEESSLLPAYNPPKYHLFDLFPFSLPVKYLTKRGLEIKGKKAARLRARMRDNTTSHNLPLEISLYLSSYIAAVQSRKQADPQTISE